MFEIMLIAAARRDRNVAYGSDVDSVAEEIMMNIIKV